MADREKDLAAPEPELLDIVINGKALKAKRGSTVLEAAEAAGIYIPTLCHHAYLSPTGSCRLCAVEVEGMRGLPCACTLSVAPGMAARTETPRLAEFRRGLVEDIVREHPRDCLICPENMRCELQRVATYVGLGPVPFAPRASDLKDLGTFFSRDYSLCIRCGRCVRVCHEVRGNKAIYFLLDEKGLSVGTPMGRSLMDSGCRFCGACVDVCPTGALVDKRQRGLPERMVKTICPYCGVGCQLDLEIRDGKIMQAIPDAHGPANHGQACVKGRFGIPEFVHSPDRLVSPLVRRDGELVETSWDDALDMVASKLKSYAPDEVAVIASAKCTNEENYLLQKFARSVLGTHNIDHCARL
jgi:predicted molibdopterin-dependent oxidoreductase YjgC